LPEPEDLLRAGVETLRSAWILLEHGQLANAISRAYYAMVYPARALLARRGLSPRTQGGSSISLGRSSSRRPFPARQSESAAKIAVTWRTWGSD